MRTDFEDRLPPLMPIRPALPSLKFSIHQITKKKNPLKLHRTIGKSSKFSTNFFFFFSPNSLVFIFTIISFSCYYTYKWEISYRISYNWKAYKHFYNLFANKSRMVPGLTIYNYKFWLMNHVNYRIVEEKCPSKLAPVVVRNRLKIQLLAEHRFRPFAIQVTSWIRPISVCGFFFWRKIGEISVRRANLRKENRPGCNVFIIIMAMRRRRQLPGPERLLENDIRKTTSHHRHILSLVFQSRRRIICFYNNSNTYRNTLSRRA